MIALRPYQSAAVEAVYRHLRDHDDNPVVVIPTGGGKTPVMATLCDDAVRRWDGRVLVLAHVKELLEQTAGTLQRMAGDLDVGVYSAGLRRRDTDHPVIVAGIQSVYKRAGDLFGEKPFDVILIDEAHMIPPEGDGMYRTFLADAKVINPNLRTVGLTATPFRMTSGSICQSDHFLNRICYEIGVKELIRDGYLCPLRTKAGIARADTSGLHIRGGEFIAGEVEELMDRDSLVRAACGEIVQQTVDRQSVLIFASGVQHGLHVVEQLQREHGVECGFVCGETPTADRDRLIARFRRQEGQGLFGDNRPLKYLCNVNVLTTGFDAPNVDCIAMLRPTLSPGLYYQMVGRGFRLCEGKADCLVLDFGGNVMRHGPVDDLRITEPGSGNGEAPAKECPDCHAVIHAAYANCPECGHAFPP
ncbi:MAG: DEAD/DEAH box helicase family protein, partial [Planctomycetes bacterium]|nr:DEAD/DEAH box helicase family protein [Planctomycetota bacterium]